MPLHKPRPFDRREHVYSNDSFVELVKDAVRFFNGTPVLPLPLSERFIGRGVYAFYYTGKHGIYKPYSKLNRLSYEYPIYVGKAVPKGWRQGRIADSEPTRKSELCGRIREHCSNIVKTEGPSIADFACRFVILDDEVSDMIGSIEAALIKINKPLWNTSLDGFGNHTPGNGRFQQAKSDWDVIHPGRPWAEKCLGKSNSSKTIQTRVAKYFALLEKSK